MSHEYELLNNCGPVSAAMVLSYYGLTLSQRDIAPKLKGNDLDKNVTSAEMSDYLESLGFRAPVRVNGDLDMLRRFVSNGIPVIVEQWLRKPDGSLVGHFRAVRGYDAARGVLFVNDPYSGPDLAIGESDFDWFWRAFARRYFPVYKPEQERLARAILGDEADDRKMNDRFLAVSQAETRDHPRDPYSWFNLGTANLALGRYAEAAAAYDRAVELGVPTALWWYETAPFEAYNAVGQYDKVIALTGKALAAVSNVEELYYERGKAYAALGDIASAQRDFERAIAERPWYQEARRALDQLQHPERRQRREKPIPLD
jgi:tetratricopeptide (TPR) repeat protein